MRPKYQDLKPGLIGAAAGAYDFVERKWDGLYAELVGNAEGWSIHGRNGAILAYGLAACPDCYLRGEFISGTEEAEASRHRGAFVPWDVIYWENAAPTDYQDMRRMLVIAADDCFDCAAHEGLRIHVGKSWAASSALRQWKVNPELEGLIFRSADGQRFARMKRIATRDYIVTGYREKGPAVTAIFGGLYNPAGELETVVTVPVKAAEVQRGLGAMTETIMGRVFEAKGNAITQYGSLRHPRQSGPDGAIKWRPDKPARDCTL